MKKSILIILMTIVLALMSFAAVSAAEVTFKAVAFIPKNHPLMYQTVVWVDMINKEMAGKVKINYIGGPEVIPGMQQAEAVKNGVIDIAFNPTAYYQNIFPEAGAFILSKYTPSEERKPGGFYDYMVKQHERINCRYIGRVMWTPFYLWPNKEVKTLADLKGMKMRTSALYDRFMKALGIVPVTIPPGIPTPGWSAAPSRALVGPIWDRVKWGGWKSSKTSLICRFTVQTTSWRL